MQENSARSFVASVAVFLLVWLSIAPVIGSIVSFLIAMPARFPALVYFDNSPLQWRLLFLLSGLMALIAAWLIRKNRRGSAFATTAAFAVLFVLVSPLVWGHRTFAMAAAVASVFLVGSALIGPRRHEV